MGTRRDCRRAAEPSLVAAQTSQNHHITASRDIALPRAGQLDGLPQWQVKNPQQQAIFRGTEHYILRVIITQKLLTSMLWKALKHSFRSANPHQISM
jgi:hypothetical protein